MRRVGVILLCGSLLALVCPPVAGARTVQAPPPQTAAAPSPALPAQAPAQAGALPGVDASRQWRIERLGQNHWKLTGDVEIEREDVRLFADEMEIFTDTNTLTAKGNVVFTTPTHRVSADRAEFNLKTKLGTFFNASGSATLGEPKQKSQFGTQESDVYFYGTTLEKIGEKKYRITDGGFTTCVQPRPRWEMTSGTVILSLDHYALLTNSLLKVKGVPLFYLPVVYYPINKEDRGTGFLIPVYGTSSYRGQTISNAFFWAINRSQDATILHDWFSKTGQGYGAEYRYIASRMSQGDARFYVLREKPTETTLSDGTTTTTAGRKGFEVRSNVSQELPFKLKGRARVDYFSEIQVQQTYYQNIYDASRRQRYYGGNLSGTWGVYTLNASADRSEMFFDTTNSTVTGSQPRLTFSRAERPVKHTPLYAAINGEYISMVRQTNYNGTSTDFTMRRLDLTPTVRFPFRKWAFLTANTSVAWRYTRWNQSRDDTGTIVESPVSRTYFDVQTRIVGPVFNRIWNTDNGYAEKIKHTIEPNVTIQRVTSFDTYSNIVQLDGSDYILGGTTRVVYGINNRVYAKRKEANRQGRAREIFNLAVRQTYYTDERASLVDGSYASGFNNTNASKLSPVSIQARAIPLDNLSASLRVEYDQRIDAIRTLGLQATYTLRDWINTSGTWNKQRYFSSVDPKTITLENQYLTSQTSMRFLQGRLGGDVSFNYDVSKKLFLQKRFVGYYNAQCCGLAVEYQVYDFSGYGSSYLLNVQKDKRFNISFTLAGVGTFSNFFGALGGNSSR